MKKKRCIKLTPAEAKRLEQYVDENGGQVKASIILGVAPWTLSRTANRHTGPSPMLVGKLVEIGVVKAEKTTAPI